MVFRQRNSQRFEMDMSAAEVKRAASAQPSPSSPATDPNGSDILVKCLQAEGVQYLWGYPGGAVLYIYDALYKQDTIQHVLVRHEQAAVHAADGYARATGEVGVALVTSGPGVHRNSMPRSRGQACPRPRGWPRASRNDESWARLVER